MTSFPLIQTTDPGTSQYMIIPSGYIGTEAVQYNGLNYQLQIPGNTAHTIQRQDQAAGVSDFLRPEQASREADKLSPAQPPMPETDNEPAGLNIKRKTDDNQDELESPKKRHNPLSKEEPEEMRLESDKPENKIRKQRNKTGIFKKPASKKKLVRLPPKRELELTEELKMTGNMRPVKELAQSYGQSESTIYHRISRMRKSPQLEVKLKNKVNLENEFMKRVAGTAMKSLRQLAGESNLTYPAVKNRWRRWHENKQKKPAKPPKSVPGTTGKGAVKPTKPVPGTTKEAAKPPKPVSGTSGKGAAQPPVVNWLINDLSPRRLPGKNFIRTQ